MASRLEKVGTIFTRVEGLLQRGVIKVNDRPLWFDIYKAFPPLEEPFYGRPEPKGRLREIFYEEDKIRSKFHAKGLGTSGYNLKANSGLGGMGGTRKYIEQYNLLASNSQKKDEELIEEAAAAVSTRFVKSAEIAGQSVTREFLEASKKNKPKAETVIKEIFE